MRVLWLSNKLQTGNPMESGTWLDALATRLLQVGGVELCNIAFASVTAVERCDAGRLVQWAVPGRRATSRRRNASDIRGITRAIEAFGPDLVHVWGTEGYWGTLTANGTMRTPALLELQGLKMAIANVYYGGLSFEEQLKCIGIKEVLRGTTVWQQRRAFKRWGDVEKTVIRSHRHVAVQSEWQEAWVRNLAPEATVHRHDLPLRDEFYRGDGWRYSGRLRIFCSAAYPAPFKGLHVAARAVANLRQRYPEIQLRIAGPRPGQGIRRDGYLAWLGNEIERLGVRRHVVWLGPIPASAIVDELLSCSAFLVPTYVESYCVALFEAMALGVPVVASYAGSLPGIVTHENSALFAPPGDEVSCAAELDRVMSDQVLAERLSRAAKARAAVRCDPARIVERQLEIYRAVSSDTRV